jgi:hypothetical protein
LFLLFGRLLLYVSHEEDRFPGDLLCGARVRSIFGVCFRLHGGSVEFATCGLCFCVFVVDYCGGGLLTRLSRTSLARQFVINWWNLVLVILFCILLRRVFRLVVSGSSRFPSLPLPVLLRPRAPAYGYGWYGRVDFSPRGILASPACERFLVFVPLPTTRCS